jgi:hypothetical protein
MVFEILQPALRRRCVLDHPSLVVEGQNARNVCPALFGGGLQAERGHLETVAQVWGDVAEKVGLPGLEVRASRLADQVYGAPEISAGSVDRHRTRKENPNIEHVLLITDNPTDKAEGEETWKNLKDPL